MVVCKVENVFDVITAQPPVKMDAETPDFVPWMHK
jgi:hypothetical protein